MEIYNFFSEPIRTTDTEKCQLLSLIYQDLTSTFDTQENIKIVQTGSFISIIGQIYGEDLVSGDTELNCCFMYTSIKFVWINANDVLHNNFKEW